MDEILIEKVREHELIYNHRSPDYRDHHIRQTIWEEIGRELKMPGNKAKEQWDKLRRCFCNAKNRRRDETKNGMASKKKSVWKYEQQMAFLIPFIETRKTHSNLNESQTSFSITTEPEDFLSDGSDAEEIKPLQSKQEPVNLDAEFEGAQSNQAADDGEAYDTEIIDEKHCETDKIQNKNRKKTIETSAHQMVQILKDNSVLRKRKYEDKNRGSKPSKMTCLETMDDTDLFFLSMSRMTKKLPKVDQAQVKLVLSNSVLSAEMRNQKLLCTTTYPQHSLHQFQQQPMTSPSDYSNEGGA